MSAKDIQKMFSPVIHHEDGAYWAEIPAMPGCFTVADTLDELGPNLMEAMTCWLLASADAKRAALRPPCENPVRAGRERRGRARIVATGSARPAALAGRRRPARPKLT